METLTIFMSHFFDTFKLLIFLGFIFKEIFRLSYEKCFSSSSNFSIEIDLCITIKNGSSIPPQKNDE